MLSTSAYSRAAVPTRLLQAPRVKGVSWYLSCVYSMTIRSLSAPNNAVYIVVTNNSALSINVIPCDGDVCLETYVLLLETYLRTEISLEGPKQRKTDVRFGTCNISNIMAFTKIGRRGVDLIHLAQDRNQCRAVVNTVMKFRVLLIARNFFCGSDNCPLFKVSSPPRKNISWLFN
jgi:hypothetical protein